MTRWLCWIGCHSWEPISEVYMYTFYRCRQCGKEKIVRD